MKKIIKEEKDCDKVQLEVDHCTTKITKYKVDYNQADVQLKMLEEDIATWNDSDGMGVDGVSVSVEDGGFGVEANVLATTPTTPTNPNSKPNPKPNPKPKPTPAQINELVNYKTALLDGITEHEALLKQLQLQLDESTGRVLKVRTEEQVFSALILEESSKKNIIIEWMLAMQGLLWPETQEEYVLGLPKVSDCGYLPVGLRNAIEISQLSHIFHFNDVQNIIESFLWMTWCSYALAILRGITIYYYILL